MVVLDEISNTSTGKALDTLINEVVVSDTSQVTTHETPSTIIPCHSGRIIMAPYRFMFLGEAYEAISKGPKSNLKTYKDEVIDMDAEC